ncbi:hypothetical protein EOL94_02195 [bacterium]|nr:hypothetical protein [bacterium]
MIERSFELFVEPEKELEEIIKSGNYDFVDPEILCNMLKFKRDGLYRENKIIVDVVCFEKSQKTKNIIEKISSQYDSRPADIFELLTLGKAFPKAQRKFPIVSLGTKLSTPIWKNISFGSYPVLESDFLTKKRKLTIRKSIVQISWDQYYRFLIVNKKFI